MLDFCPKCRKLQLLRSRRNLTTKGAFMDYNCSVCGTFVKSEQLTINRRIKRT